MKWCERCQCHHRDQPVTLEECIAPAVADVAQVIDAAVISERDWLLLTNISYAN